MPVPLFFDTVVLCFNTSFLATAIVDMSLIRSEDFLNTFTAGRALSSLVTRSQWVQGKVKEQMSWTIIIIRRGWHLNCGVYCPIDKKVPTKNKVPFTLQVTTIFFYFISRKIRWLLDVAMLDKMKGEFFRWKIDWRYMSLQRDSFFSIFNFQK